MSTTSSNTLKHIEDFVAERIESSTAPLATSELSELAAVRKTLSETRKNELDLENQQKTAQSESIRFWTPIVTSFVSTIILAATLLLQINDPKRAGQQTEAIRQQTEANEDIQWREAIKIMVDKPNLVNGAAGEALLKYFLNSKRHGAEARDSSLPF